jgi:hypothetical protein
VTTYWVDGTRADDTGNGLTAATAKKTPKAGYALITAKGDILNIINSGTYNMTTAIGDSYVSSGVAGTNFDTDPGFIIQGTDALGNPAMTAVTGIVGTTAQYFVTPRSSDFVIIRYFNVDMSPCTGTAARGFLTTNSTSASFTAASIRLEYIQYKSGTLGTDVTTNVRLYHGVSTKDGLKEVRYCSIEQPDINTLGFAASSFFWWAVYNCVFIVHNPNAIAGFAIGINFSSANHIMDFHSNTIWAYASGGTGTITSLVAAVTTGANTGSASLYDNVFWFDAEGAGTPITDIVDGGTVDGTPTAGTRGTNIFYSGPSVIAADIVSYYGRYPWDADNDEANTGDVKVDTQADTVLFNDPSSTYAWDPDSRGVDITVPKDLRLIAETTSGQSGGLPGALPAASVDPSIAGTTTDPLIVVVGDKLSTVFTYTEDVGNGSTGTTVSLVFPTTFTLDSTSTASGTYATGVWTLGTVASGATAKLTANFTVNADVAGDTLNVVGTITAHGSGIGLGGTTSNDTSTVVYTGLSVSGGPENPDSPSRVPLIDVLPTVEPRFKIASNIRLRTRRNRAEEVYLRHDVEEELFSEYRSAVVSLATNTSLTLNMGGVERAEYIMAEADNAIQISMNGGSFLPNAKMFALLGGAVSSLKLKNTSTTNAAEVFVVVVD